MGRTRKKDSSVVFIGEDDESKAPLLSPKDAWSASKSPSSKQPQKKKPFSAAKTASDFIKPFPRSFCQYLVSEGSIIIRILSSLFPPVGRFKRIAVDFEGSFLSTFLLTATVYWGLVNSKGESRLHSLGHSLGLTMGYLILTSGFTWVLAKGTKTTITYRQIVSVLGYGLFGHAIVLLTCEMGSNEWFMPLMTVVGGLDSFRICLILLARTPSPAFKFVLCTPVAIIHLFFLIYLHFAIMKN